MSVAFRRESDEEHLEPKFELPIPPGPNLVTARGFAQIESHVEAITARVAKQTDEERRKHMQRDLRYWQTRRATAEIVEPPSDGTVGIGTRVRFTTGTGERVVRIVGIDEGDPKAGLIGFQAPLARALMGSAESDEVAFGDTTLTILSVEVDDGQG